MRLLLRRDLVCQQAVELVTDYLEGALSRRARRRFEAHLAGCPHCTEYLAQMRETIRLAGRLEPEDLTPEHAGRIRRTVPPVAIRAGVRNLPPERALARAVRVMRRCRGPARPPSDRHREHRPGRRRLPVLPVAVGQQPQRLRHLPLPGQDHRPAVGTGPPQRVPVVGVFIGEHGDPRILPDVPQPLQVGPGLRLLVDGRVDRVTLDREGDHHHMRLAQSVSRSQARHGHAGEPGPRFGLGKPHAEDVTVPRARWPVLP